MKNLKNIIASIILVVISFVSYTQDYKYNFYLDSIGSVVDTFNVSNTFTPNTGFSLSVDKWDLDTLNSDMYVSMDSTINKIESGDTNTIDGAVTGIFLISEDYGDDYQYFNTDLAKVETAVFHEDPDIDYIENIEDFITTLIDSSKTYTLAVFRIEYIITGEYISYESVYAGFAIDYAVADGAGTSSIDTEVIEVSNTRVYPNPVMNSLNIEFETINTDTEVEIYSTTGQLMYKDVEYRNFGVNKISVDMSNYPSGMYIVRLGNEVKKVIKQ